MRPDYFEGTLQLRDVSKRVRQFVYAHIEKTPDVHIAKEGKVRGGGIDLYLSSKKYMAQLGKLLEKKFPGKTTITRKLFGYDRQHSKQVYRVTVLFRQYPFREKSTITYRDEPYIVQRISEKVHLKHKETGKRISVKYSELK